MDNNNEETAMVESNNNSNLAPENDNDSNNKDAGDDSTNASSSEVEDLKLEVEKWKALSRKNEDVKNKNFNNIEALEKEIKELKNNFEEERANLSKEKLELSRRLVSREFNLPDELSSRLRGNTEDELREDAKTLTPLLSSQNKGAGTVTLHGLTSSAPTNNIKATTREEWLAIVKNNNK